MFFKWWGRGILVRLLDHHNLFPCIGEDETYGITCMLQSQRCPVIRSSANIIMPALYLSSIFILWSIFPQFSIVWSNIFFSTIDKFNNAPGPFSTSFRLFRVMCFYTNSCLTTFCFFCYPFHIFFSTKVHFLHLKKKQIFNESKSVLKRLSRQIDHFL